MDGADAVFGLILAGGRSSRFGREKAMAPLGGEPLIARVEARLAEGVTQLAVSAGPTSGAAAYAAARGLVRLGDAEGTSGPLAGILPGLRWAQAGGAAWLLTAPCDVPFLPEDFARRMWAERGEGGAIARTADGLEPLCALWPVTAAAELEGRSDHPAVRAVLSGLGAVEVCFNDAEAFANLNTPEAFAAAQAQLG